MGKGWRVVACALSCVIAGIATTWCVAWALGAMQPFLPLTGKLYSCPSWSTYDFTAMLERRCAGACRRSVSLRTLEVGTNNISFGPAFLPNSTYTPVLVQSHAPRWGGYPWTNSAHVAPDADFVEDARGWPFLSQWCDIHLDDELEMRVRTSPATVPFVVSGGILVDQIKPGQYDLTSTRILPWRPIWPGFLANSAIYAAAWFLVLGGRHSLRAHIRHRRGLCPRCAHDLRASPTRCPECAWQPS
jgi:hypothetical protein